jgi:hydroxypyruvate isomerase
MMAVEISASISALYPGMPPDRACALAVADGFTAVEFWSIAPAEVQTLERSLRAHGLTVTSLNAGTGSGPDAFGLLGDPSAVEEWRGAFVAGLDTARRLQVRAINLLVGGRVAETTRAVQLDCVRRNLEWCLPRLGDDDPVLLIEPLNAADRRSPLVRVVSDAVSVLDSVGRSRRLGILFDAYHLHQEEPDLHDAWDRALPFVRHVQIADHPGRGEPGTGTLPIAAFVAHVVASGYDGWIGCEFIPSSPAVVPPSRVVIAGLVTPDVEVAS